MASSEENGNVGPEPSSNTSHQGSRSEWVRLNVGGRTFLTSRATLTKDPQSFLARIANEETDLGSDKVGICR